MRLTRRAAVLSVAALLATPALATAAAPRDAALSVVDSSSAFAPWLEQHLTEISADEPLRVALRGTSLAAAEAAAAEAGLAVQQRWAQVAVVVAIGTPAQVQSLRGDGRIAYVEGDTPLSYGLQTAHEATRSNQALASATTAAGGRVDGSGVTVAVIDSGIDGTHPMFQRDGKTTVVRNVKNVCGVVLQPGTNETCFQQIPSNDTDTISAGGHGTHVAGIAAGVEVVTAAPGGTALRGSAPGAHLVGLSVGAAVGLLDAMSAQNWVLEHQQNPCRSAAQQTESEVDADCPPIRVTNHSYGPAASSGGNTFTENSAAVQIQRALVAKGVVAVWAAGNDGGDGSSAFTNPTGMDPTPGIVMVASYDDAQNGNPDNALSSFSSRGEKGNLQSYPDLAAPGDRITSACRLTLAICQGAPSFDNGNYQTISGTSMAAPYVAGVVAQLFGADPTLTPAQVEAILEDTAHAFTAGGPYEADPSSAGGSLTSFDKGHGLVDVLAAISALQGTTAAEREAALPPAPRCGDGTALVTDPAGDTNAPGGTPTSAPGQDLTQIDFAGSDEAITVTSTYVNLSQVPAVGSTSSSHSVTWIGPDGVRYGVTHVTPGGGFLVGTFDPTTNRLVAGTATPVTGVFTPGAGGQISWTVPFAKIGNPVLGVDQTLDPAAQPAVSDSYGVVLAGIGALGTGLTFTAPVDRAPDGGATPVWSVCNSTVVEEPPAEGGDNCTSKGNSGRSCTGGGKDGSGKGGGKGGKPSGA